MTEFRCFLVPHGYMVLEPKEDYCALTGTRHREIMTRG